MPPHVPSHAYRVIEHVRQPLFDAKWGADEELLLLEAIEMFGFGNWSDIAEHVSTKTKTECEQHYNATYLNASTAPLPDLATAITHLEQPQQQHGIKQEDSTTQSAAVKAESDTSATASSASSLSAAVDPRDTKPSSSSPTGSGSVSGNASSSKPGKPLPTPLPSKPKPKSGLGHLVGYIPNRGDFDQEYENDAELLLADMEFKEEDTKWEKELKLKVIDIYNVSHTTHTTHTCSTHTSTSMRPSTHLPPTVLLFTVQSKLDARLERKKFILERGLLERKEKKRGKEEREIWNNMRVFARFHSAEEHEQFVQGLVNEARLRRRIERLQQWRMNGVKTLKDGERYEDEKKRREDRRKQQTAGGAAIGSVVFGSSSSSSSKKRAAEAEKPALSTKPASRPARLHPHPLQPHCLPSPSTRASRVSC